MIKDKGTSQITKNHSLGTQKLAFNDIPILQRFYKLILAIPPPISMRIFICEKIEKFHFSLV